MGPIHRIKLWQNHNLYPETPKGTLHVGAVLYLPLDDALLEARTIGPGAWGPCELVCPGMLLLRGIALSMPRYL